MTNEQTYLLLKNLIGRLEQAIDLSEKLLENSNVDRRINRKYIGDQLISTFNDPNSWITEKGSIIVLDPIRELVDDLYTQLENII